MCMVYDGVDEYLVPGTMGALKKVGKKKWLGRGEGQVGNERWPVIS